MLVAMQGPGNNGGGACGCGCQKETEFNAARRTIMNDTLKFERTEKFEPRLGKRRLCCVHLESSHALRGPRKRREPEWMLELHNLHAYYYVCTFLYTDYY